MESSRSIEEYLTMARECLAETVQTSDPVRRESLIDAAKLYTKSALEQKGVTVPTPDKAEAAKAQLAPSAHHPVGEH